MTLCERHVIALALIKQIGSSGQISLGKEYAGRNVLIEKMDEGVWIIKTGRFIPDNEKWMHQPHVSNDIDKAIAWAEQNPPKETDLNHLEEQLKNEPGA